MTTQETAARQEGTSPLFRDRLGWYLGVSAFWFATSFKWFIVLQLVPGLVRSVVPEGEGNLWWGRIAGVGAVEAMLGPALFGYLSDRTRSRFGRRRPYIAIGAALTAAALLFLAGADSLWMFFAGYIFLQISDDIGTGPYAALIPDQVPEERRGKASGILSQLQLIAQIVAAVAGLMLGSAVLIFVTIAVINIICAAIVLMTVRERRADFVTRTESPRAPNQEPGLVGKLSRGAREWAAPWKSRDFRWVWFTRFLNALGFYIILSYVPNYLRDSVRTFDFFGIHLDDAFKASIVISLTLSLSGAVSAVFGGPLADRIGRKRVILYAGWLMFLTLIPFSLIPRYGVIMALAPFFGIGYGAYLSASWALAADVLPSKEDAAKDMGIWQMSVAAPQVVAGFVVGLLIHLGNRQQEGLGYTIAFLFASCAFLAGSVLVSRIKGSS